MVRSNNYDLDFGDANPRLCNNCHRFAKNLGTPKKKEPRILGVAKNDEGQVMAEALFIYQYERMPKDDNERRDFQRKVTAGHAKSIESSYCSFVEEMFGKPCHDISPYVVRKKLMEELNNN